MDEEIPIPSGLMSSSDSSMLGDLSVAPRAASFAGQDPGEVVYIIARRDIITTLGWVVRVGILIISPIILIIILNNFNINLSPIIQGRFSVLILLAYYAFTFTYMVININDWFFNVFIVTNRRILDFDFKPLSSFTVAEAELTAIQDVSESVIGVIPSFFDYGDLQIQTAGEKIKFIVKQIPRPTWLRNILVDLARIAKNPEP